MARLVTVAALIALGVALAVGLASYGGRRRPTVWELDYPDGLFVG